MNNMPYEPYKNAGPVMAVAIALLAFVVIVVGCTANPKHPAVVEENSQAQPTPAQPTPSQPSESAASKVTGYDVQTLLEHRTNFVGDNSKVVALIDLLPLLGGVEREEVVLQTAEEPYGITIQYKIDNDTGITMDMDRGDPFTLEQLFYRHAAILLSLIGNADYIVFKVDDAQVINGGQDDYEYRLDRKDIEAVFGGDVRKIAEDQKLFSDYVAKVKQIGAVDRSPPQVLQPDSEGKYVLSHNEIRTANGDALYVNLEMVAGKHYTEAEAGGPGGGVYADNYSGTYQLRVVDSKGETVSTYSAMGGRLNFSGTFNLAWADYNGDGRADFTLGQFANSNSSIYEIYSLNEHGQIEKLNTNHDMYIADHSPSILLDQIDETSFTTKSYTPDGGNGHSIYNWEGGLFWGEKVEASQ
ncbi:DUF4825 domain-containing protein [Cohnella yongneupensis]|uniref:DUF4825 domain-containing protein n=1 Tax=Cohnella yongneupensis TaxID=425006 RepID=A0ABW0R0M9_9BACL